MDNLPVRFKLKWMRLSELRGIRSSQNGYSCQNKSSNTAKAIFLPCSYFTNTFNVHAFRASSSRKIFPLRRKIGYRRIVREAWWNAGGGGGRRRGNLVMDWHPFQGRVVILPVVSCYKETGMSSGRMGHVARMQTLPFHWYLWFSWTI